MRHAVFFGIVSSVVSSLAIAGDLNPPAGPVAPTHKTLTEVESRVAIKATNTPGDANSTFKITQPGSYYLVGNLTGASGRHGIEIAASGVHIDLNGYDLAGVPGSLDGISVSASNLTNIRIRNGSVRNWGQDGLDLSSFSPTASMVIEISASTNGGNGIVVGPRSTVTLCHAVNNSSNGILATSGCTITTCTAAGNALHGIGADHGCTITDCTAYQNTTDGIAAGNGCNITNCTAYLNSDDGISASSGGSISNCTSRSNSDDGIFASSACTVSSCTASTNTSSGITVGDGCRVVGNSFNQNGNGTLEGAGIRVVGNQNHIEANNTYDNGLLGLRVDGIQNVIISNWFRSDRPQIASNNMYGRIASLPLFALQVDPLFETQPVSPATISSAVPFDNMITQ